MTITEIVKGGRVFLKESQFSFLAEKGSYKLRGKRLEVRYVLEGRREFYGKLYNAGITAKKKIKKSFEELDEVTKEKIRNNFEALDELLTDFGRRKEIRVISEKVKGLKERIIILVDSIRKYEVDGSLKRGILDYVKGPV